MHDRLAAGGGARGKIAIAGVADVGRRGPIARFGQIEGDDVVLRSERQT
jgi:hypothetical protein